MVREILVDWTTASGGGKVSVLYFLEATTVAEQRAALGTWLGGLAGGLHSTTQYSVRTEGRELDTSTGALTGAWVEPTVYAGAGTASGGQPIADATQVLVRWQTGNIVGGRFLQGRTYIPGLMTSNVAGGNLAPTVRSAYAGHSGNLVSAAVQLAVWHRPTGGAGGEAWAVEAASVWTELAVQRRRRG